MKTKYTAGPWEVHGDNHTLIGATDGKMMLAECFHRHPTHKEWDRKLSEAQANARLIAAAPELLAAVVDMMETIVSDYAHDAECRDARLALARAALAKAGVE